ncbi:hypothetical protein GF336_00215 [Candidatus Woesearchaeota archaeon]|nr:hypothetical protein [Candidatus Woesearchaeota archaeon]
MIKVGGKKMGNYCQKCGKEMEYKNFDICKECYLNKNKPKEKEEGLDTNRPVIFEYNGKQYPIPIWALGILFVFGVIIGASLW